MYTAGLGARILTALEDDQKVIHVLSGGKAGDGRIGKTGPCAVLAREQQRIRLLHAAHAGDGQRSVEQALMQHAFCQRTGERERMLLREGFVVQRVFGDGLRKLDRRLRRHDGQHYDI